MSSGISLQRAARKLTHGSLRCCCRVLFWLCVRTCICIGVLRAKWYGHMRLRYCTRQPGGKGPHAAARRTGARAGGQVGMLAADTPQKGAGCLKRAEQRSRSTVPQRAVRRPLRTRDTPPTRTHAAVSSTPATRATQLTPHPASKSEPEPLPVLLDRVVLRLPVATGADAVAVAAGFTALAVAEATEAAAVVVVVVRCGHGLALRGWSVTWTYFSASHVLPLLKDPGTQLGA